MRKNLADATNRETREWRESFTGFCLFLRGALFNRICLIGDIRVTRRGGALRRRIRGYDVRTVCFDR